MGKQWKQWQTLFSWVPKSLQMVIAAMKLKDARSLEEKLWKPRQNIKKQRHYFANKGPSSQSYGFASSHGWMRELDHKDGWAPKNWCFWTEVLEKTLESPLNFKEIKPIHPKGNQSWTFTGRTNAEAEAPILLATWCKKLTHWKSPWCWQRLKAGEGDEWGWDGWMASLTRRTWVWANSRSWWWTGKPGRLQSMGSQRARTQLSNRTEEQREEKGKKWGLCPFWGKGEGEKKGSCCLSRFSCVRLCASPPSSTKLPFLGISRQEHWSGLPLPSLEEN